jgi:hypothetical protein
MSGASTQKSMDYRRRCLNGEMSDNSHFSMDFGFAGGSRRKMGILSDFGPSRRLESPDTAGNRAFRG